MQMMSVLPEKKEGLFPYLLWGKWECGQKQETGVSLTENIPGPEDRNSWQYALGDRKTVDLVLSGLSNASRVMGSMTRHRRSQILSETARLLDVNREALANLLVCEVGKPISAARFEVERAATTFLLASRLAMDFGSQLIPGDIVPQGARMTGMVERVPIGPVLAITPYNFPLNLLAHKVAPALASGCPVVVKPAPKGALSALALGKILLSAGLPPEALSIVPCDIPEVLLMVDAPEIPVISFTGSAEVGWSLRDRVPRKQVLLELGGNAAVVILKDAREEGLVDRLMTGAFAYSGQICISIQRILVDRSRYDSFLKTFVERVRKMEREGGIGDS
jgi:acyl-CoA reductase-like NAD-dependent aldehyde dehydrogenase